MTGSERRQELLQLLSGTQTPISGTSLAKHFTVSRQVIVQDMALLRAQGHEVLSTNRGYLIQAPLRVSRIFKVFHTSEQIVDELCTIVDLGGTVEDVFVHHKVKKRQIHATERCHFRLPLSYRLRRLRRNSGSDRTGVRKERISLPVTFWR